MQSAENKSVSVVMCTYNGEKYITQQLESILNQTYPLKELLIQDDGSTDTTIEIIEAFQKKYPTLIRLHINETRLGINKNFLSVMEKASGDFIAISDQDDIWERNKIERQVGTIGDNLLCFCLTKPFSENDDYTFRFSDASFNYGLMRCIFVNVISGHVMLIRKELLKRMPFTNDVVLYDYWLALLAIAYEKVAFCNEVLCHHRRHESAATFQQDTDTGKSLSNMFRYILSALGKRKKHKKRAQEFYFGFYRYLSLTRIDSPEVNKAKRLLLLMSETNCISSLRAGLLCIREKDKIFHHKDSNNTRAIVRAFFHPYLCYHYLD